MSSSIDVKVALLGDSGVGKTSIIKRYINQKFDKFITTTIGAAFCKKIIKIDDTEINLKIWDTAGQEIYKSLGRIFYKEANVIIFVYDITLKASLENIKKIWYPELKENGEEFTVLAVVGNKCDMYEEQEDNDNFDDEAKEYAKSIDASFFLVSAKTGIQIDELFEDLGKKLLEKGVKIAESPKIKKKEIILQNDKKNEKKEKSKKNCCE